MKKRIRFYTISACLIALILLFFWYENHHLVVTEYIYQSDKVKDNLKGYRIIQISDLHNAEFGYDNENVDISAGDSNFCFIGLDENSLTSNTLKNIMEKIENSNLSVVLAHEPQYLSQYALTGCDLVLAGHAHGGQFVLPFLGAVVAPDQGFFPQYTSGKHQEKQTTMYISRGLGNSIIPVRLFNAPEIVCIELESNN